MVVAAVANPKAVYSMQEVAKHTSNTDCWVVLHGRVLNVTNFLKDHPGGELAILTFGGKDASDEFDMIHPPDVVEKYAPDVVIGMVGADSAAPAAVEAPRASPAAAPAAAKAKTKDVGDKIANHTAWGDDNGHNWRIEAMDDNPGVLLIPFYAYMMAGWVLAKAILWEVCATIFATKNFKITNDRLGLTRSAIMLIMFIMIHALGNLHVFLGPDDFNGYGLFYVRLYWTGFGLPANIVEEYLLLSILLHVLVGLKRSFDKMGTWKNDKSQAKMAVSGTILLTFMTIHLMQFRFGETADYMVRPPPLMVNFSGLLQLELFWSKDPSVTPIPVRNIYDLEFRIFSSKKWCIFYVAASVFFMLHACWGWANLVGNQAAFGIPKLHMKNVKKLGWGLIILIGLCYISFPVYVQLTNQKPPADGAADQSMCIPGGLQCNTIPHFNPWA